MGYIDEVIYDSYPCLQRILDPIGILLFLLNLAHSIWYSTVPTSVVGVLIDVVFGLALADFVLGFGHMISDRFDLSDQHHAVPANVLRRGFWCLNAENTLITFILKLILMTIYPCNAIHIASTIGSYNGSYHYWHHTPQTAPWIIRMIWKSGIVVDYRYHRLHHQNHNDHYTLITSWSEPFIMWIDHTLNRYKLLNTKSIQ
jgi:hypothetical protein